MFETLVLCVFMLTNPRKGKFFEQVSFKNEYFNISIHKCGRVINTGWFNSYGHESHTFEINIDMIYGKRFHHFVSKTFSL
jgi:hypothetical protein